MKSYSKISIYVYISLFIYYMYIYIYIKMIRFELSPANGDCYRREGLGKPWLKKELPGYIAARG